LETHQSAIGKCKNQLCKGEKFTKIYLETFFVSKVSAVLRAQIVYQVLPMEVKEKILARSEELFMRYGFKSITMDEVANHCNISKKTIYQFFSDKDSIINEVVQRHMSADVCRVKLLQEEANSALDEIMRVSEYMKQTIGNIHPSVLYDLKKYHPGAWETFNKHKHSMMIETVSKNLKRGLEEGVYRSSIDIDILARLRCLELEAIFNSDLFPTTTFNPATLQIHFVDHFIRGICTPTGLTQWEEMSQKLFQNIR